MVKRLRLRRIVPSILFMVFTSLVALLLRKLVKRKIRDNFVQNLFNEAIAAAELCADCFELIIVADNFGVLAYAICLFLLTIWWSHQWEDASACPYIHLENYVNGESTLREVFLMTWAELMGGCSVYFYVRYFWSLELVRTHRGRAYEDCSADLQVPMLEGALIEGLATCMCRIASNYLSQNMDPRKAVILDSFIGTSLVVAAFNHTGGYFNPVLATALKFGCEGNTITEHLVVYWIGAIVGSIASIYIYSFLANLFSSKTKAE